MQVFKICVEAMVLELKQTQKGNQSGLADPAP